MGAYMCVCAGARVQGVHGEVVGLLGVDTLGGAAASGSGLMLGAEDVQYVHSLAASLGRVVARDQAALADLMALVRGGRERGMGEGGQGGTDMGTERGRY